MATTITVSTLNGLYRALSRATGGETILLNPGDYGDLTLNSKSGFDITFPSNVTIASADRDNPASFSGMVLSQVSNLTLDGVVFDYDYAAGDKVYERHFNVLDSQNVTIRNSLFDGDVASGTGTAADGYGFGTALMVQGSSKVVIENNEFQDFQRAMCFLQSSDLVVSSNDVHSIRSDGMNFVAVTGVQITDNYLHDFNSSAGLGDHADMIQFWTNGTTTPSTDIVIRGNLLDIGNGSYTQSIFMRNEEVDLGRAGTEMYYQNVLIEENAIINAHSHGITVGQAAGVTIRQNSVLHADGIKADGLDSGVEIPQISVAGASTGVTITGNLTSDILGHSGQAGWVVNNNLLVQDQNPAAARYYGDLFISSTLDASDGQHGFLAKIGGVIDARDLGATLTREIPSDTSEMARFNVTQTDDSLIRSRTFSAAMSGIDSTGMPDGTIYEWTFGDGSTARGRTVSHSFADGGTYAVTLKVTRPDGVVDTETAHVGIQSNRILSLDEFGAFVASEYSENIALPGTSDAIRGLQLGGVGSVATVGREHVADLFETDTFRIRMLLDADQAGASGEVFRIHGSISASVTRDGELSVTAWNDAGTSTTVTTSGAALNTIVDDPDSVSVRLLNGKLQVIVNGSLNAEAAFSGTLRSDMSYSLAFGNPWGNQNFRGDLLGFAVELGKDIAAGPAKIAALAADSDLAHHDALATLAQANSTA